MKRSSHDESVVVVVVNNFERRRGKGLNMRFGTLIIVALMCICCISLRWITRAEALTHSFSTTTLVANTFNASSLSRDQSPVAFIRVARGMVPTLSNPFVLIASSFGLNQDGKIVVSVKPVGAYAYRGSGNGVNSAQTEGNSVIGSSMAEKKVTVQLYDESIQDEKVRVGSSRNSATSILRTPLQGLEGAGNASLRSGFQPLASSGPIPPSELWYDRLPSSTIQRIMPISGGASGCQSPTTSRIVISSGGAGDGVSTSYQAMTTSPDDLQQLVLAPMRTFLYVRVVARDRVPKTLTDRVKGYSERSPTQWSSSEIRLWCSMPSLASGRINPLVGGRISYVPPGGTSVQTVVYIIQCSDMAFAIDFEATLYNGGGSVTTLENLQIMTVYSISAGLEFFPLLFWVFFMIRNGVRGRGWVPSRRDLLIFVSLFTATLAAGASVAWVASLSRREDSGVSIAVSSIRLVSLLIRDCVGFVLMPFVATGYCTILSTLTLRIRAFILVSLVAYTIFTAITHVCTYENSNIDIDETTCESITFGQVLLRVMIRILSVFLLIRHIQKLTEAMMVNDNPAFTSLFFRYKALRLNYFVLTLFPIISYLVWSSVVSWFNRFIVTVGYEMEIAYFHFVCVYYMGAFEPVLV